MAGVDRPGMVRQDCVASETDAPASSIDAGASRSDHVWREILLDTDGAAAPCRAEPGRPAVGPRATRPSVNAVQSRAGPTASRPRSTMRFTAPSTATTSTSCPKTTGDPHPPHSPPPTATHRAGHAASVSRHPAICRCRPPSATPSDSDCVDPFRRGFRGGFVDRSSASTRRLPGPAAHNAGQPPCDRSSRRGVKARLLPERREFLSTLPQGVPSHGRRPAHPVVRELIRHAAGLCAAVLPPEPVVAAAAVDPLAQDTLPFSVTPHGCNGKRSGCARRRRHEGRRATPFGGTWPGALDE